MNIMELGALGEFLGSIGVVATLIYLALQVRQNSQSMKAGAYQKIVEDRASISNQILQEHLTPVWRRGVSDYRGLLATNKHSSTE